MRKAIRFSRRLIVGLVLCMGVYVLHVNVWQVVQTNKLRKDVQQANLAVVLRKQADAQHSLPPEFVFNEADMKDEHGKPYHIIIWNDRSGVPGYLANPTECLGNISCQISYDKGAVAEAHAIVFPVGISRSQAPSVRKPWQLYAWWTLESPLHSGAGSSSFDDFFNLTIHYRLDAGVYSPYGSINLILRELKKAGETKLEPLLEKKRNSGKMAAWAVSNCYGKRMEYAQSL
uniref:Fucosyltransferase N-terminal domain-containing protein n=1 Tax=Ciona savignyi TaxID=51511 RepID=H2ZFV4_CIOSA